MNSLISLTGVHPDESIFTQILSNKIQQIISDKCDQKIPFIRIDLEELFREITIHNCRYRVLDGSIFDLNRVYRKKELRDDDVIHALKLLIETSTIDEYSPIAYQWFTKLSKYGININDLLQGSQSCRNGFFG